MSTEATVKFFVTKYALSQGILKFDGLLGQGRSKGVASGRISGEGSMAYFFGEGKDWHLTLESALKRAEELRKAKLVALHRQISEIEKLDFSKVMA